MGNVDFMERHYCNHHIYVHSAKKEALGLSLIEAMASGLPVITLDGKGNRDIIEQDRNGYIFFDQDANAFAEKILSIWGNKKLYDQMSEYAHSFAAKYDIENYIEKLIGYYNDAIAKNRME